MRAGSQGTRERFADRDSDLLANVRMIGAFEFAAEDGDPVAFCRANFLRSKQMFEVRSTSRRSRTGSL